MIEESNFFPSTMDMATKLSSQSYYYYFDYKNMFTFNDVYGMCGDPLGVSHSDEMISLFPFKALFPDGLNSNDIKMSKMMVKIWVKFASSE